MSSFHKPDCPLCPDNGEVDILERVGDGYLTQALKNGVEQPGRFLIVPNDHLINFFSLSDDWIGTVKKLVRTLTEDRFLDNFNLSFNFGRKAGQTLQHIHTWVLLRDDGLELGMSGLIDEVVDFRKSTVKKPVEHEGFEYQP